jgi:hypothetical protein
MRFYVCISPSVIITGHENAKQTSLLSYESRNTKTTDQLHVSHSYTWSTEQSSQYWHTVTAQGRVARKALLATALFLAGTETRLDRSRKSLYGIILKWISER